MTGNAWPRVILHADMDAFFASVEQHDDPSLRGKPVIVGGIGNRGVVSAASYEARRFGVRSAMPAREARQRCPHGLFLRPRFERYREVSNQVFEAMRSITPIVEGLSLDEAFLDITASVKLFGGIRETGEILRKRVLDATGLNVSIGIAPNKFVAKIASDLEKPAGFVIVPPTEIAAFLDPLPVRRLWGLGEKTLPRIERAGLRTFADIRHARPELLRALLGNQAERFRRLAAGLDDRPVEPDREDKSVSAEETFPVDITRLDELETVLLALADKAAGRLRRKSLLARTVTVKIREADFTTHTRSHSFAPPSNQTSLIYKEARELLRTWRKAHPGVAVRLLGVGTSQFAENTQNDLFAAEPLQQARPVDHLVDAIRGRFGGNALTRGKLLERQKK